MEEHETTPKQTLEQYEKLVVSLNIIESISLHGMDEKPTTKKNCVFRSPALDKQTKKLCTQVLQFVEKLQKRAKFFSSKNFDTSKTKKISKLPARYSTPTDEDHRYVNDLDFVGVKAYDWAGDEIIDAFIQTGKCVFYIVIGIYYELKNILELHLLDDTTKKYVIELQNSVDRLHTWLDTTIYEDPHDSEEVTLTCRVWDMSYRFFFADTVERFFFMKNI